MTSDAPAPDPYDFSGCTKIAEGIYFDEAQRRVVLDAAELCRAVGLEPTEENRRIAIEAGTRTVKKIFPGATPRTFSHVGPSGDPGS